MTIVDTATRETALKVHHETIDRIIDVLERGANINERLWAQFTDEQAKRLRALRDELKAARASRDITTTAGVA